MLKPGLESSVIPTLEKERERKSKKEQERESKKEQERERNNIEISTYLFVMCNKQIKLSCFRQKQHKKWGKKHHQLISIDLQMQG